MGAWRAPPGGAGPPEGLMSTTAPARLDPALLRKQVDELDWYHTSDLPGGIVTPGLFAHRKVVAKLPIPASLAGKPCLDAASAERFFALELAPPVAAAVASVAPPDITSGSCRGR